MPYRNWLASMVVVGLFTLATAALLLCEGPVDEYSIRSRPAPVLARSDWPVRAATRIASVETVGLDLRNQDLRRTPLRGANLRHADLRGANLSGVDLRGA